MSIAEAVILGIVQGLSEFLPISSSGHLIIAQNILGVKENLLAFDVLLHLGTLVPVFAVFWNDILRLLKNPFQKMTLFLIIGTFPAVIAALFFGDLIDKLFEGGIFLAVGYIATGILLTISDKLPQGKKTADDINPADALAVGTMQAIAITPGLSRSGSTIAGSIFMGLDKETAASFSFLLSIPAILGAAVLQVKDILTGDLMLENINPVPALSGFIAAALSGYIAIRLMLGLIKKRKLKYFAIYVFILAGFIIADYFLFGLVF